MKLNPDDFLQPNNPRFETVYGYNPYKPTKEEKRKKENEKQHREDRMKYEARHGLSRLKPWDVKDIIKYAREKGLE